MLEAIHQYPDDQVAWAAYRDYLEEVGIGYRQPERVNSIGMRLALIPAGTFLMGSPLEEAERSQYEGPQHKVQITRAFYMGVFPVTQEEYQTVMGTNPSHFRYDGKGKDRVKDLDTSRFPVESVLWDDAIEFCRKLTDLDTKKPDGYVYRLPSEAEWEYACRAGTTTPFHFGNGLSSTQANFDGNYPYGGAEKGPCLERPSPVGSYLPNAFGLYDMHGNVWEWCADYYDKYQEGGHSSDPRSARVLRGGSWINNGGFCRSAYRRRIVPGYRDNYLGFRVALSLTLTH